MPASDIVDLCSGDSDSDSDLPPLASLTARLQQRRAGATSAAATAAALTEATAAAPREAQPNGAARAPLLAVHNQVAGSLPGKQHADSVEHESPPRQQYHQQEQRQQQQQREAATPPSGARSGPRRGKRAPPDAGVSPFLASQQSLPLGFGDDEEWRPGDSPASQPAKKKQRRPKRTREEIEADKALKARRRCALGVVVLARYRSSQDHHVGASFSGKDATVWQAPCGKHSAGRIAFATDELPPLPHFPSGRRNSRRTGSGSQKPRRPPPRRLPRR